MSLKTRSTAQAPEGRSSHGKVTVAEAEQTLQVSRLTLNGVLVQVTHRCTYCTSCNNSCRKPGTTLRMFQTGSSSRARFNDITDYTRKKVQGNCLESAKDVASFAARFRPGSWCFCGPGSKQTWKYTESRLAAQVGNGEWDKLALRMTRCFITSNHLVFKCGDDCCFGFSWHGNGYWSVFKGVRASMVVAQHLCHTGAASQSHSHCAPCGSGLGLHVAMRELTTVACQERIFLCTVGTIRCCAHCTPWRRRLRMSRKAHPHGQCRNTWRMTGQGGHMDRSGSYVGDLQIAWRRVFALLMENIKIPRAAPRGA